MMVSLSLGICGADSIIKYFVPSQSQIERVDDAIYVMGKAGNRKQVQQLERLEEMLS